MQVLAIHSPAFRVQYLEMAKEWSRLEAISAEAEGLLRSARSRP